MSTNNEQLEYLLNSLSAPKPLFNFLSGFGKTENEKKDISSILDSINQELRASQKDISSIKSFNSFEIGEVKTPTQTTYVVTQANLYITHYHLIQKQESFVFGVENIYLEKSSIKDFLTSLLEYFETFSLENKKDTLEVKMSDKFIGNILKKEFGFQKFGPGLYKKQL